jgi:hypothetical protein
MRRLIHEVNELHRSCQEVPGRVVPGGTVEFDDLDTVMFALDHALVSVRTLDQLFEGAHKVVYVDFRTKQGMVIDGLVAPRTPPK